MSEKIRLTAAEKVHLPDIDREDSVRFCPKCGLARSMNSVSYTDIPLEEFHTGKRVNQVAYVLLAALLGCFGIHKFYAGKIGMGILYLFFKGTKKLYI